MDTLSSLFSKNFKKDPALLKFYGINEDLYEGKKLISKRQRTKNKIAKKSPLLEGFANQLDDLTISEDQETANLNADLQRNLSSYATSLKTVVSDYVVARKEKKSCEEKCNKLPATAAAVNKNAEITSAEACTAAGGTGYAYCADTGVNYCCGVCGGGTSCPSNSGLEWCACASRPPQKNLRNPDQMAAVRGKGFSWGTIAENILWQGAKSQAECAAACDANPECTAYEICNNGEPGTGCKGCYLTNKPSNTGEAYLPGHGFPSSWAAQSKEELSACNIDEGLAFLESAGCTAATPEWISKMARRTLSLPHGMAFGQQSNGCWHILQWAPKTTGANKKTRSMYPKYFALVRPPQGAQCAQLGQASAAADAEKETTERKNACLAGCELSDAYLEETAATTPTYNNEAIGDCGAVAPNPTACGPCAYMHWYWSRATQEQQCGAQGSCCKFTDSFWGNTCSPTGVGSWCPNPPCSNSAEGAARLEACENSKNENQQALSSGMDGRNLTQEYSDLNSRYLSDNQCNSTDVTGCTTCQSCYAQGPGYWCSDTGRCSTHGNPCTGGCGGGGYQVSPEPGNVLSADGSSIDSRIKNILSRRQQLNTTNNDERQTLVNTLNIYKGALKNLKKNEQGITTLKAMAEDAHLKRSSANLKYYIWLGLAICVLMIAIRQLKK